VQIAEYQFELRRGLETCSGLNASSEARRSKKSGLTKQICVDKYSAGYQTPAVTPGQRSSCQVSERATITLTQLFESGTLP
jgi:hypothetical protein